MTAVGSDLIIPKYDSDIRKSAEEMDEQRHKTMAYEYLCHLEEAKKWMEACLREQLPPTTELEENLRNGVYLAKLANFMDSQAVPLNKIFDIEQKRYGIAGLQFRHTDNINFFLKCMKSMQLPLTFQPETTDIYDKKNMPRVIYCIHALSTHLFKLGRAPQIQDLYGKVNFTDAEIDAVSKELKKYGIQMPAFQKIGGLLTNSMAGDTAALHAAVIAINQALSSSNRESMLNGLQNSATHLQNVHPEYMNIYFDTLSSAKDIKTQAALNRSLNDSYVPDAYDELLTPAEIQGHLNNVNSRCAFEKVMKSLDDDEKTLLKFLNNPDLQLQRILPENVELYQGILKLMVGSEELADKFAGNSRDWQNILQSKINLANDIISKNRKQDEAVEYLNQALEDNSPENFCIALMNPYLGVIEEIDEFAIPLYFDELKIDRADSQKDISLDDTRSSIRVLTAVAAITKAIDIGNPDIVYQTLLNPDAHVTNLDEGNKVKYYQALEKVRYEHRRAKRNCKILSYIDIQECIDFVNQQCNNDDEAIAILRELNNAVKQNNRSGVISALKSDRLNLKTPPLLSDASLYLKLFKKCLEENHMDGSELWLEDIENVSQVVIKEVDLVQDACNVLSDINIGLDKNDEKWTVERLIDTGLKLAVKHRHRYYKALKCLREYKKKHYTFPYIRLITPHGVEAFLDLERFNYTWDRPHNVAETHYVTKEDIQEIIKTITAEEYNLPSGRIDERLITRLQALSRGYLLRKKMSERLTYFYNNTDKIVKIQAAWRGFLQRRSYKKLLEETCEMRNKKKRAQQKIRLNIFVRMKIKL